MDESPVAGPSRPRRAPDLADRIVNLQRKNAAAPGPSRVQTRREVDEFSRGARGTPRSSERVLFDPSRPLAPAPPPSYESSRPSSSRGDVPSPLPSAHAHHAVSASAPVSTHDERHRRRAAVPGRETPPGGSRRLFDPSIHDPHHFAPKQQQTAQGLASATASVSASGSGSGSVGHHSGLGPSRSGLRRPPTVGRTAEEEADRERERRKRREGSERGGQSSGSGPKKRESDGRSRGSRSSEGSESFKDRERGKGKGDTGVKAILKEVHDKIKTLETELTEMHKLMAADPEVGISVLLDRPRDPYSRDLRSTVEDAPAWLDLIAKHKELADLHHEFLVRVFDPLVPSSLHQLTVRYNIPSRLWQVGFHLILERLRHAWMSGHPAALDLLTDLVYDAYKFYTDLLEDLSLAQFRTAWIEALGDLARYRMAIASHLAVEAEKKDKERTSPDLNGRADDRDDGHGPPEPSGASIGAEVAQSWDVEDKETWRTTARDWYTVGITEKPGEGRLHHHLALLCRDVRGQEPTALHHFAKSLTVTHSYETSRESILPLFDSALQSQRSLPEATAMDLFVRLHGMLFTKISLDSFPEVMSRFMERLEEDASLDGVSRKANVSQVDWMIMATVNIAAVLQYGAVSGMIRRALAQEGAERRRAQAQANDDGGEDDGEVDDGSADPEMSVSRNQSMDPAEHTSPIIPNVDTFPSTLTRGLELTFAVFAFTLKHPNRLQGLHHVLSPYITLLFTFLATLYRQPYVGAVLTPYIPWHDLVVFLNSSNLEAREETRLVGGAPLPEDWAVRGMEWVGRRVYERGFWKGKTPGRGSGAMAQPRVGERFQSEMDVLLANFDSAVDISEGVVDEVEGTDLTDGPVAVNQRRWKRVVWAAGVLVKHVDGLQVIDGQLVIEGTLAERIKETEEKERRKIEEEEQRRMRAASRTVEEDVEQYAESESEEDDSELAALRERRKYLRSLLNAPAQKAVGVKTKRAGKKTPVRVVPGYTMLVFDTNVLLSAIEMFSKVVEGGQWSVVVPLPVVTELDGLSKSPGALGTAAIAAISYLEARIRTHSLCLKIQTSKGNYLSDLLIRTEHVEPTDEKTRARTMDDLILNIASFQADHFVDRSKLLGVETAGPGATKVLLVTFDRNLRLRARARGLDAADEKEMAGILGRG